MRETNGLNQSMQHGLDSLCRVKTLADAASASASLKYDARDAVTESTDFKGVMTNFTRDAQGKTVAEVGTDIGARSTTYDALGQPTGWTWAFGAVSGLNGVNLATPRSYDTAGHLLNVATGGQTVLGYAYDAAGRVSALSQLLAEPVTPNAPNSAVTTTLRSWLAGYDATGRSNSFNRSGTATPTDTAVVTKCCSQARSSPTGPV